MGQQNFEFRSCGVRTHSPEPSENGFATQTMCKIFQKRDSVSLIVLLNYISNNNEVKAT